MSPTSSTAARPLVRWTPTGSAVVVTVLFMFTVAPAVAGWTLLLALVVWGRAGWEWGLFGEPEVPPDAWATPVTAVLVLACVVLVVAACVGVPMIIGLSDRTDEPDTTRRRRRRQNQRLAPVVLLSAAASFGVLLSTTEALLLVDWAEQGFDPAWLADWLAGWW